MQCPAPLECFGGNVQTKGVGPATARAFSRSGLNASRPPRSRCGTGGRASAGWPESLARSSPVARELAFGFQPIAAGIAGQALLHAPAVVEVCGAGDGVGAHLWRAGFHRLGGFFRWSGLPGGGFFRGFLGGGSGCRGGLGGCGFRRFLCSLFRSHGRWKFRLESVGGVCLRISTSGAKPENNPAFR